VSAYAEAAASCEASVTSYTDIITTLEANASASASAYAECQVSVTSYTEINVNLSA
jgi:hypothetical protein